MKHKERTIRPANSGDLEKLLELYTHLHDGTVPAKENNLLDVWEEILCDRRQKILVIEEAGKLVSSCVLVIVPNLTHGQRPYALVENVVTRRDYRGQGCGSAVLEAAKNLAAECGCYKIMLMTGSKKESTLRFYEKAGYRKTDKTAFVQWL
ncbi:GNAT family N-acetyltransferase [Massiliimalia timonensis]|uniref:GNAT family N-acetyltransferase n=1 Tax=Massiliimalia timonensis TaxID=1987501 RepID=UPI00189CF3EB|nr:GNAT family N-acetyltransferase [Massiliimalia timonensis]